MLDSELDVADEPCSISFILLPTDGGVTDLLKPLGPRGDRRIVMGTVRMGEIEVSSQTGEELVARGLGSCIGLALIDRRVGVAGMAHIVLPEAPNESDPEPGKFADLAVPELISQMKRAGAVVRRLDAVLAGGARMFELGEHGHRRPQRRGRARPAWPAPDVTSARPRPGATAGAPCALTVGEFTVSVKEAGGERHHAVRRGRGARSTSRSGRGMSGEPHEPRSGRRAGRGSQAGPAARAARRRRARRGHRLRTVDFSRPTKFTADHQRRIARAIDTFCQTSVTRLSTELRTPVELETINTTQATWSGAQAQLPSGSLWVTLDVQPLGTRMLLTVEQSFILMCLDCLLGGSPDKPAARAALQRDRHDAHPAPGRVDGPPAVAGLARPRRGHACRSSRSRPSTTPARSPRSPSRR